MDESEDNTVLELNEQDCGELAYAYLKYTGQSKVLRCSKCGKLIKQSPKFGNMCKGCKDSPSGIKIKWCVDCGQEYQIDSRNMTKSRCDACQHEADKAYHREYMRNKRSC